MDISQYKHKIIEVVRFHEVDIMGVCNNAVYFNYFEDARIKYLQDLKETYKLKIMEDDIFFIMAHNECDYIIPALFDDHLEVYTKISKITNSSITFEHLIRKENSLETVATGGGVLVHINLKTKKSLSLPAEFCKALADFEKEVERIKTT